MKKLMIAAVVAALGVSAFADELAWFNGGIGELWPTNAAMKGGSWTVQEGAKFENNALTITAPTNAPVTFEATQSKDLSEEELTLTIKSTVEFSPFSFDELPPVPEGAKGGVILVKENDESLKYYVLADEAQTGVNEWTLDQTYTPVSAAPVEVQIMLIKNGDGTFIDYQYGDAQGFSGSFAPGDGRVQYVCYAGDGKVSTLAATYTGEPPVIQSYTVTFSTNTLEVAEATLTDIEEGTILEATQVPEFTGGTWDVDPVGAVITCNTNFNYTIQAPAQDLPTWIDPADTTNAALYRDWATVQGVTNPDNAKQDAFLLNCANNDEAIEAAKAGFKIQSITVAADGTVTVVGPDQMLYNGSVIMKGATTLDGPWTTEAVTEKTAKFFKAFLELIPAN